MNILLENWGKVKWIKDSVTKAKNIVRFIQKLPMPLAIFRKHKTKLSILLLGKIPFASKFIINCLAIASEQGIGAKCCG